MAAPSVLLAAWRNFSLPDEDIVTYFTNHPEEDGTRYDNFLRGRHGTGGQYFQSQVMAKYAANLLIRRSQVQDHLGSSAADAYLRDQL